MRNLLRPRLPDPAVVRWVAAGVIAASLLSSCATRPVTPPFRETSSGHWENGIYTVVFVPTALHQDAESRVPGSHFEVSYTGQKGVRSTMIDSWQDPTFSESGPSNVSVLASPDPDQILISDLIPNDCQGWANGSVVTADSSGELHVDYYEMPETFKLEVEGEAPTITEFTGKKVVCHYRQSGETITVKTKDLHRLEKPRQPG